MKNYKILGKKAFLKQNFTLAQTFFSLAKQPKNQDEILFLIELCELAKDNIVEASFIFDYYSFLKKQKNVDYNILNSMIYKINENENEIIDSINFLEYNEAKNLLNNKLNFKKNFENLMFSTNVYIKNIDDFLDLIENLAKHKMTKLGFDFLEQAIMMYPWNERFLEISKKLIENENKNF